MMNDISCLRIGSERQPSFFFWKAANLNEPISELRQNDRRASSQLCDDSTYVTVREL
jgi:hypothetical protein